MKKLLLLLLLPTSALAGPTIVPSTGTVYVRGQIQFSSTDTVTWSLAAGSVGSITAGGLYTAPVSITGNNVVDGCMVLPNDHIYNTRIDNLPTDANSTARFAHMLSGTTTHVQIEVSFPHNIMSNATPTVPMTFQYTIGLNGQSFPIVPDPYRGVENSLFPADYFATDYHTIGVSTNTCQFTEIFKYYPKGTNGSCPTCNATSGVQYFGTDYQLADTNNNNGAGVNAAGMFMEPLSIRYSELKAGVIKHALRFTLDNGDNYSGLLWPAQAFTNQCNTIGTCFPYGSRVRLKAGFPIQNFSPTTQVILTALKQYGMFMSDGGTAMHIQTMTDVDADTITWTAINSEILSTTTLTQFVFDQVDESSLEISTSSGKVNVFNGFETPDSFAEVVGTKNSDSSSTTVRVAIQPVTVGTENLPFPAKPGSMVVMAGTPQFQIPYWVEGATTTSVTCTMSPTVGTLTSGCLYTAPASQLIMTTPTVTITPNAEPAQAISFPLVVVSSDGIRFNIGGKSNANSPAPPYDVNGNYGPDTDGNYWWSDPVGTLPQWYASNDMSFPQASWKNTTDVGLFYTGRHGNCDAAWSAMVPNGNYTLTLGFGLDNSNGNVTTSSAAIDSQGIVLVSTTAPKSLLQNTFTPSIKTFPITVTNNQFYFAMRQVISTQLPLLNKWSLIPTQSSVLVSTSNFFGTYVAGCAGYYETISTWNAQVALSTTVFFNTARTNTDVWTALEPQEGRFNFATMDQEIAISTTAGMDFIFTLPIYNSIWGYPKNQPTTHYSEGIMLRYYDFVKHMCDHYKGVVHNWEVYNEANLSWNGEGSPVAAEYYDILKTAYIAIKNSDPTNLVLLGGLAFPESQTSWIDSLLARGGGNYFDIYNIHMYADNPTPGWAQGLGNSYAEMNKYGISKPIWITETSQTGSHYISGTQAQNEDMKAVWLVENFALALSTASIQRVLWHTLRKCGQELSTPVIPNYDFGLYDFNLSSQPASNAWAGFNERFQNYTADGSTTALTGLTNFQFHNGSTLRAIGWAPSGTVTGLTVPSAYASIGLRDKFDNFISSYTTAAFSSVIITTQPVYFEWSTNSAADVIAFDSSTLYTRSGASSPGSWNMTIGSGVDRFLVVGCAYTAGRTITGVTIGGSALTQSTGTFEAADPAGTFIFTYKNPPSGSQTLAVSWAGGSGDQGVDCGAISFSGVSQSNPIDVSTGSYTTGSTAAATLTTNGSNEYLIDILNDTGGGINTAGGSQTAYNRVANISEGNMVVESTQAATTAGTYSNSWSACDTHYHLQSMIAINPGP